MLWNKVISPRIGSAHKAAYFDDNKNINQLLLVMLVQHLLSVLSDSVLHAFGFAILVPNHC